VNQRTRTRIRLVATAGELFWRQGYAATGVSEIIKGAKATSGSFYHFFSTKNDLLLAVLDVAEERLHHAVLDPIEERSVDAAGRLEGLAVAYRECLTGDQASWGLPVGTLIGELGAGNEPARRRVDATYEAYATRVGGWFGADGRSLAEVVIAAIEGAALMTAANGDAAGLDRCIRRLTALIVEGGSLEADEPAALGAAIRSRSDAADWKAW
jgi:AcrR family transcriptional regulator